MDMTRDLGAGGCGLPYRWRPMSFEVDGTEYVNERATATQQTGFWLVAQANRAAGDDLGILWFGVDDAATSCLTPIYCSIDRVPECLSENNGSMLKYSPTSMFWLFNRVTNFAYLRYDRMSKDLQAVADRWENRRGARGHGRGAEARRGGAREVRDRLFGDDGPDLVRSVEADGRIFAGEVYRRQCEGRDRTRQIQG